MNRLFVVLIITFFICTTTVIFALRGPNDYGDSINRDAMQEHRMTDHEHNDPFMYEWVSQTGQDSDGPLYSYSGVYAEQYSLENYYTSAWTTLGCTENGFVGRYNTSASVLGFGTQFGLVLVRSHANKPFAIGSYNEKFSRSPVMSAEWTPQSDPEIINDYLRQYGNSRGEVKVLNNLGDPNPVTLHKAESEAPVEHPDVTIW